jgi:hypothetical protein
MRVTEDHGLAATEVEASDSGLRGHRRGETQYVAECVVLVGVRVPARSAECGAQHRRVDRHDRFQAGSLVAVHVQRFAPQLYHLLQEAHPWVRPWRLRSG